MQTFCFAALLTQFALQATTPPPFHTHPPTPLTVLEAEDTDACVQDMNSLHAWMWEGTDPEWLLEALRQRRDE